MDAKPGSIPTIMVDEQTAEKMLDRVGIPVVAEIEPHADPVYGSTFKWPSVEIAQRLAGAQS